jgi:alpha/beta superfamily hydrolase
MPRTFNIPCVGYEVVADLYEGNDKDAILLALIGRTSNRKRKHYVDFSTKLANERGVSTLIFDYSGHGDSPFEFNDLCPAQHFLEVINAFDWLKSKYPDRELIVMGSSYGGFMATQLTKYRKFNKLILRAPAIYKPSDFYTRAKDENKAATAAFRKDESALSKHPLLARASSFQGQSLLVVHENDEVVPKSTTDAYESAFNPDVIVEKGIGHSLDESATPEQVTRYFNDIYSWLFPK